MFEEYIDEFEKDLELEKFYALEKRANDIIDSYKNDKIGAFEYAYGLEEVSAELDDVRQSFKDLLKGNEKHEMLGKIKELKKKLVKLINNYYNLGA